MMHSLGRGDIPPQKKFFDIEEFEMYDLTLLNPYKFYAITLGNRCFNYNKDNNGWIYSGITAVGKDHYSTIQVYPIARVGSFDEAIKFIMNYSNEMIE